MNKLHGIAWNIVLKEVIILETFITRNHHILNTDHSQYNKEVNEISVNFILFLFFTLMSFQTCIGEACVGTGWK